MIEWALLVSNALLIFTRFGLIVEGVEFLFFPPMRVQTSCLENTPFLVLTYESTCLPILTKSGWVVRKEVWFTTEVLPIVSIVALGLVVLFVERTPFGFEVEHVKVWIFCHEVDYSCFYIVFWMGKRAILAVIALVQSIRIVGAKFCFVFFNMV